MAVRITSITLRLASLYTGITFIPRKDMHKESIDLREGMLEGRISIHSERVSVDRGTSDC